MTPAKVAPVSRISAAVRAEAQATRREHLHWGAVGAGVTYCIYDSSWLQLPWWQTSQPEGLRLGGRISMVANAALLCSVPTVLLARQLRPAAFRRYLLPVLICCQGAAGLVLASGLWTLSSAFIYIGIFLAYTVGSLTSFATVPWLLSAGFKPPLVSSLYAGGSAASLLASILAMIQSPGDAQRFSPQVFFLVVIVQDFQGGVGMMDDTFLLGHLHFLQELSYNYYYYHSYLQL